MGLMYRGIFYYTKKHKTISNNHKPAACLLRLYFKTHKFAYEERKIR